MSDPSTPDKSKNKYTLMIYGLGVVAIGAVIAIISWFGGEIFPHTNEAISAVGIEVETTTINTPDAPVGVVFFDLGGADSSLIVSRGEVCLIDGGSREDAVKVINYIQALGYKRIHYIVATGTDSDCMGGLGTIASNFYVDNVILPDVSADAAGSYVYRSFTDDLKSTGAKTQTAAAGLQFTVGDAVCDILAPAEGAGGGNTVVRLKYEKCAVLFASDLTEAEEASLLESYPSLRADILKVANGGAASGVTEAFIRRVHPPMSVISTAGSESDFPSDDLLRTLFSLDSAVYRTDASGDITVRIESGRCEILTAF